MEVPDAADSDLYQRLHTAETRLHALEDQNLDLRAQLAAAYEESKKGPLPSSSSTTINSGNPPSAVELKHIHSQLLHKDQRIIELNNELMEKERVILDLQEACREQGQVAASKKQAMAIVNQRLQQLDAREVRDASTETVFAAGRAKGSVSRRKEPSPGRAVPQFRLGGGAGHSGGSPPPADPSEDLSSFTTETITLAEGNEEMGLNGESLYPTRHELDGDQQV